MKGYSPEGIDFFFNQINFEIHGSAFNNSYSSYVYQNEWITKKDPKGFIKKSINIIKESKLWTELTRKLFIIFEVIERSKDIIKGIDSEEGTELKKAIKEKLESIKNRKEGTYEGFNVKCIIKYLLKRDDDYLEISYSPNYSRLDNLNEIIESLIKGLEMSLKGEPVLNENEKIEAQKKKEFEDKMEALSQKEFNKSIKDVIKGKTKGYLARVFEVTIKDSPEYSQELFNKLMDNATRILNNEMKEVKELSHWERIKTAITITKYPIRELKIKSKNYNEFKKTLKEQIQTYRNAVGQDKNIYLTIKDIHEFITNPNKEFKTEKEFSKNKDKIIDEILKRL